MGYVVSSTRENKGREDETYPLLYVEVRFHCFLNLRKVVRKSGLSNIWAIPKTEPYGLSDMALFAEGCVPIDASGANKPRDIGKFSYFAVRSVVCQNVTGVL